MSYHTKLLASVTLAHILVFIGLYVYWDPVLLVVGYLVSSFIFVNIGQEGGLHRYFSHRSYETTKFWENTLTILSIWALTGNSLGWVARHRTHHRYSDTEQDPHRASDSWRTWFWLEPKTTYNVNPSIVKDMLKNPIHKFTRDHYFKIYWGGVILTALLFGPKFTLYFVLTTGAFDIHSSGLVNVFCHKYGYRNYDTNDTSTNNTWVNVWVKGAGLHNNHHARPWNYTTKVKPWEWDVTGWVIKNIIATSVTHSDTPPESKVFKR